MGHSTRNVIADGLTYIALGAAIRKSGIPRPTLKKWAASGSDGNGHLVRTVQEKKGKLLLTYFAEADIEKVSLQELKQKQAAGRYDRTAITIDDKRYLTLSRAALVVGMTPQGMRNWLGREEVLGFNLEVIRFGKKRKRLLVPEDNVLAIAAVIRDAPAEILRQAGIHLHAKQSTQIRMNAPLEPKISFLQKRVTI